LEAWKPGLLEAWQRGSFEQEKVRKNKIHSPVTRRITRGRSSQKKKKERR
jgi:hypothetical protein